MHSCRQQTKITMEQFLQTSEGKVFPTSNSTPSQTSDQVRGLIKTFSDKPGLKNFTLLSSFLWKLLQKYIPDKWGHKLRKRKKWNTGNRRSHSEERWRNWQEDEEADPNWRLWPGTRVKEAACMQLGRFWPGFPPEDKNKRIADQPEGL